MAQGFAFSIASIISIFKILLSAVVYSKEKNKDVHCPLKTFFAGIMFNRNTSLMYLMCERYKPILVYLIFQRFPTQINITF